MLTRILDSDAVAEAADIAEITSAVEDAFGAYQRNDVLMPAKSYIDLPQYNGDFRSMPAYVEAESWDAASIKWVNVHPDNPEKFDLPTVMGTVIYSDPETAFPLALMDGTELTLMRTGAAAGVATDYLAVEDARTLGIIGAGVQAYSQLAAIASVRPIEEVVIVDVDDERVNAFIEAHQDEFAVREGSPADAASCDVLSTVTPVEDPIVKREMVGEHTHINAMGADAEGKQEHEVATLKDAKLVIDDYEQCTHSGEINAGWHTGELTDSDIDAEIGEIVTGEKTGREEHDTITVFDSTGLAIQDVAAAHVVYEAAEEQDTGMEFELINPERTQV